MRCRLQCEILRPCTNRNKEPVWGQIIHGWTFLNLPLLCWGRRTEHLWTSCRRPWRRPGIGSAKSWSPYSKCNESMHQSDCHDIAHICMGWIGWSMLKPGPMLVTLSSPRQLAARMTGSQAVPVDELCIVCPYFCGLFIHWLYLWYLSVLSIWLSIHFHASTSRRMPFYAQGSAKLLRIPLPPLDQRHPEPLPDVLSC